MSSIDMALFLLTYSMTYQHPGPPGWRTEYAKSPALRSSSLTGINTRTLHMRVHSTPTDHVAKRRAYNIRGNITQLKMAVHMNTSCR